MDDLERIVHHCDMFLFGTQGIINGLGLGNPAAASFIQFGLMHLTSTMFLVDSRDRPMGGFIYPILDSADQTDLLYDIRTLLRRDLGPCTFEKAMRDYRNRLGTHRSLSRSNLPRDSASIIESSDAVALMEEALADLDGLVEKLRNDVQDLLDSAADPA